jgi:RimJ/RimL family protein N-acetyltransferase
MNLIFDKYNIRNFRISDIDALVKYANDYDVSRFLRDSFPFPYTKDIAEQWVNFVINNKSLLYFAIADEKELIGGISAVPLDDVHRFSAEIGFWLGKPHWNKGIMTKALKVFCEYIFNRYNFNRLIANVFEGNEASGKVLEKAGFTLEGKQRKSVFKEDKFINHYIYGLLKEELIL